MSLRATDKKLVVYSKNMKYRKGDTSTRQYDFCHYKLSMDSEVMTEAKLEELRAKATNNQVFMNLKFTKLKEMNAYIYKGSSRYDAKESLIEDNK